MNPVRLVSSLLEDDESSFDPEFDDPKAFAKKKDDPGSFSGVPTTGYRRELEEMFERSRGRIRRDGPEEAKLINRNTFVVRDSIADTYAIRFHATDIIRVFVDGVITVHNGGYSTKTTLERLNEYLPTGWRLYQHQYQWYWRNFGEEREPNTTGLKRLYPFSDGDTIQPDGEISMRAPAVIKRVRVKREI